jgi:hypothetical protein
VAHRALAILRDAGLVRSKSVINGSMAVQFWLLRDAPDPVFEVPPAPRVLSVEEAFEACAATVFDLDPCS